MLLEVLNGDRADQMLLLAMLEDEPTLKLPLALEILGNHTRAEQVTLHGAQIDILEAQGQKIFDLQQRIDYPSYSEVK